jgi:hypothetical protein
MPNLMSNADLVPCLRCEGKGEVTVEIGEWNPFLRAHEGVSEECPECEGSAAMTLFQAREYREWHLSIRE